MSKSSRWRGAQFLVSIVTILTFVGGIALVPDSAYADAGDSAVSQTTDRLKLRAAPALNAEILDVIPAGAAVSITGGSENGFYPVVYAGQSGYAYGAYLTGVDSVEGPVTTGGQQEEVYVAEGPVNFRSGPSTDDPIISVIPDGALVALNGDSANGFLGIIYTDRSGWAHADSVLGTSTGEEPATEAPVTEESATEAPATEAPVTEAPVTEAPVTEAPATEAPATEAPATEAPATDPPVDGSDGYTEDEIIQIIYAAADKYGQSREDMLRVARCESVLDPNAVNSSSNASGLFQFLPSTWATTPNANQDIFDPVANADAAGWMWQNGRRNEWTCQ